MTPEMGFFLFRFLNRIRIQSSPRPRLLCPMYQRLYVNSSCCPAEAASAEPVEECRRQDQEGDFCVCATV